jgi:hypothetical protein
MLRPGFEPGAGAREANLECVRKPYDSRMENGENERIFEDFKNFLIVDRQLRDETVKKHLRG